MHYKINKEEKNRLGKLESYAILDTLPEEDYDAITKIAAQICDTEISLVSLVDADRQWFKSHYGLDATETPREYSFCSRAIASNQDIYIIENAAVHPLYKSNPLVTGPPNIAFYAGVPLRGEDDFKLGSLCVIDSTSKTLSTGQIEALKALAKQVENLLQLRKKQIEFDRLINELKLKNESLEQFAYVAAHDIKAPLNNIRALVKMILKNENNELHERTLKKLTLIHDTSDKLRDLVDSLLNYSQISSKVAGLELVNLSEVIQEIVALHRSDSVKITFDDQLNEVVFNSTAFYQMLNNFVVNSIKYNDKDVVEIDILVKENGEKWKLEVTDNGVGIAPENYDKVFETFTTLKTKDQFGNYGSGLGLSIVKKIVLEYKGEISINSEIGSGTTFLVELPKRELIS